MALDPITAGLELARTAVTAIWPDKSEQERAQLAAVLALMTGQTDTNQAEALSQSVLVAGWRPAIGWACGAAMSFEYILRPLVQFGFAAAGHAVPDLPTIDGKIWELMFSMLGFGTLRTFEKVKGVA